MLQQKERVVNNQINAKVLRNIKWYDTTIDHVKEFVNHDPDFLISPKSKVYGNRTLFNAVRFGVKQETLQWMVEHIGINLVKKWRSHNCRWTLIHIAAYENFPHLIPYLLSIHIEACEIKDDFGRTPIICAKRKGNYKCVSLLQKPEQTVETYRQALFVYRDLNLNNGRTKRPASV